MDLLACHIMQEPAFCRPDTRLQDVARTIVAGEGVQVVVVQDEESQRPVGLVAGLDLTFRIIASGVQVLQEAASAAMRRDLVLVSLDTSLADVRLKMQETATPYALVLDDDGRCRGVVDQWELHAEPG